MKPVRNLRSGSSAGGIFISNDEAGRSDCRAGVDGGSGEDKLCFPSTPSIWLIFSKPSLRMPSLVPASVVVESPLLVERSVREAVQRSEDNILTLSPSLITSSLKAVQPTRECRTAHKTEILASVTCVTECHNLSRALWPRLTAGGDSV